MAVTTWWHLYCTPPFCASIAVKKVSNGEKRMGESFAGLVAKVHFMHEALHRGTFECIVTCQRSQFSLPVCYFLSSLSTVSSCNRDADGLSLNFGCHIIFFFFLNEPHTNPTTLLTSLFSPSVKSFYFRPSYLWTNTEPIKEGLNIITISRWQRHPCRLVCNANNNKTSLAQASVDR